MKKITLTIDGTKHTAQEGMTILEAAQKAGITIPTPLLSYSSYSLWCMPSVYGRDTQGG